MQHPSGSRQGRELRSGQAPEENSGAVRRQMKTPAGCRRYKMGGAKARPTKEKRPDGEVGAHFLTNNIILQNADLSSR